jgi:hypothetical protein
MPGTPEHRCLCLADRNHNDEQEEEMNKEYTRQPGKKNQLNYRCKSFPIINILDYK